VNQAWQRNRKKGTKRRTIWFRERGDKACESQKAVGQVKYAKD